MTQNIITYIQVLAAEKNLEPEDIFTALELALATVTEKNYEGDVHLQCQIDRKSGESTYHRVWTVVDDNEDEFNPDRHIRLKDTLKDYEGLEVGDDIVEDIDINSGESNADVGRIEIQDTYQ